MFFETVKVMQMLTLLLLLSTGEYYLPYSSVNILACTVVVSDDLQSLLSSDEKGVRIFSGVINFSQDGFAGLVTFRKNPTLFN